MDPNFAAVREKLAEAYEAKQMYPEAIAEYQKWAALVGDGELAAQLGPAYAASGYKGAITKWIEYLGQTREQDYTQRAMLHSAVGDKEQAFLWLGKAYDARSTWLYQLRVAPVFDGLRSDGTLCRSAKAHRSRTVIHRTNVTAQSVVGIPLK